MTRRLRARVYVRDANGRTLLLAPDQDVPDWAAGKITNPAAWVDDPDAGPQPAAPISVQVDATTTEAAIADVRREVSRLDGVAAEPPPRSGKGSGRASWAAYAAGAGVQVDSTVDRDGIIAAVLAAGLPA